MSNNKDFKVKNGIKPTVYNEAVGTVVSGTEGYYLSGASYDSKSFLSSGQGTHATGLSFKTDGTKMYILNATNDSVYQYSLSTAWDVSTASYDSVSFSITSQDTEAYDLHIKTDGTKFYVAGYNSNTVYQYSMSTAWDLSTASYDSVSFSVASQENQLTSIYFKTDGTKLYAVGITNDTIYQYTLSTAWNVSTASYDSVSFSVGPQETFPASLEFNSNGSTLFVIGGSGQDVNYYALSTAWDISTASYTGVFDTSSQDTNPQDIFFKPDGTKMYLAGRTTNRIHQYSTALNTASLDLSTGSVFDYTPTSDVQVTLTNPAASGTSSGATLLLSGGASVAYDIANAAYSNKSFSLSSQSSFPRGQTFKPDGTKFYITCIATDKVYQYSLSTAWDVSTASYDSKFFSTTGQESTGMGGIRFNTTGTKMYLSGTDTEGVYQYSLSTAWDVSTASYDNVSLDVSNEMTSTIGLDISSDGTKVYIISPISDLIYQYNLSTAYDLSTGSYSTKTFNPTTQEGAPYSSIVSRNGDKLFVLGAINATVYQYSLSTAFDISTASYDNVSFSVSSEDSGEQSISFSYDGTKMYFVGDGSPSIHQYNTVTPATITYDPDLQWSGGTAPTSPAIGETDVITFNTTDGGTTYQAVQAINGAK